MNYNKVNNLFGWLSFLIAAIVYISCTEPSASWWDCGEFIACCYKLEIGHPPGAPLFMMLGRIFSLFAFGNVAKVALMINIMSALLSAFTILFLFWSITAIAQKMAEKHFGISTSTTIVIMASGFVGALAYTFSDSFWFSAVEGEVYATSSFFTAIVFWAILKWERVADEKHANKWIVLIAYLMGLSTGVHLLNLLVIPAICFVYYFRKYKPAFKGIIITAILSVLILGFIQYGVIAGIINLAAKFELIFVNSLNLPFGSGLVVYGIALLTLIIAGLIFSHKKRKVVLNTTLLCFTALLIGFSTYSVIVIRSASDPPMDENNPENIFTLLSYINREQYGDSPLFYGPYYNAPYKGSEKGAPMYMKGKTKYVKVGEKEESIYDNAYCTFFPRMYSKDSDHIKVYKAWAKIDGDRTPTFIENLKFFFDYQVGFMYLRYFMWNFAGRQNDYQGYGSSTDGNWISGIPFFDSMMYGSQKSLPKSTTENKGRNVYYMLPFILGMLGIFFHFRREKFSAWIVMLLFFMTGLAIIIYLNQPPNQPRERDYAYAGSFYTFTIWIGIGVLALFELVKKRFPTVLGALSVSSLSLLVPVLMASQGWDDHNRSGKTSMRDFAENYLNSCAPNAVLFTNGDNDTFPLWYLQEVEGIRTDVRVVNLTLLSGDWHIMQCMRKAYKSNPLPLTLKKEDYDQGKNDYLFFEDGKLQGYTRLKKLIEFIGSEVPESKLTLDNGELISFFPTKKIAIAVDSSTVINNGTVPKSLAGRVLGGITWEIKQGYVLKNDLMLLDFIATNNWERPIYFVSPRSVGALLDFQDLFRMEGLAYRLVPIMPDTTMPENIATDIMYDNMMHKYKWGGVDKGNIYPDDETKRMVSIMRGHFGKLAQALIREGKKNSAKAALDKCVKVFPAETVEYDFYMLPIADAYFKIGANTEGTVLCKRLMDISENEMTYYCSILGTRFEPYIQGDAARSLLLISRIAEMAKTYKQSALQQSSENLHKQLKSKYYL